MTIDELKEHCERAINPENKLAFDVNSRTYQEHKLTLDIIEELKAIKDGAVFYSNRPIEDIVLEAKLDTIDECIDELDYCVTVSECQCVLRELKEEIDV